jgi:hypothetical protein
VGTHHHHVSQRPDSASTANAQLVVPDATDHGRRPSGSSSTHYLRNLLTKVPKSAQPWIATLVRTIFDQPDADAVHAQFARVVTTIEAKFPAAAEHLDAARDDLLAFTGSPARSGARSGQLIRRSA